MKAFRRAKSVAQGVDIVTDDVHRVDFSERPFSVWTGEGEHHRARTVIIATGAQAKWLGLESESALQGRGVSACAVCDGAFFRNQDVIVVGGGDTAMEEATYLSGICRGITLVHRRSEFRASKTMQERVVKNPKIKLAYDSAVEEVLGVEKGEVTGARIRNLKTNQVSVVPATGLFVAIGHTPNTDLFAGQIDLHDNGYIRTQARHDPYERARRVRLRRRAGLHVPSGGHRGRQRLHGRARCRALDGHPRPPLVEHHVSHAPRPPGRRRSPSARSNCRASRSSTA